MGLDATLGETGDDILRVEVAFIKSLPRTDSDIHFVYPLLNAVRHC